MLDWVSGVVDAVRSGDWTALLVRSHAAFVPLAFKRYAAILAADGDDPVG